GKDIKWPTGQGAKGSDGVTSQVKATSGAIGYAETSYAKANSLGMALIKNASGSFVGPTTAGVQAALKEAQVPDDLKVVVNYTAMGEDVYPISTTTWSIVFTKQTDATKGKLLQSFLLYAVGPGQAAAEGLSYAPLPQDLQDKDAALIKTMQIGS